MRAIWCSVYCLSVAFISEVDYSDAAYRATISNNHAPSPLLQQKLVQNQILIASKPETNATAVASSDAKESKQVVHAAVPVMPVVISQNGNNPPKFMYVPFLRRFAWVLQSMRPSSSGSSGPAVIELSTHRPGSIHVGVIEPNIDITLPDSNLQLYPQKQSTAAPLTTAKQPVQTSPYVGSTTPMRPFTTYKPPIATRSPMQRESCVVEPPFCPSCLSKLSTSEPWFPFPPPLFVPNACSRCGTLQVILNRLPDDVTIFADILKLASFGEIIDFNELLNEADGHITILAPVDTSFAHLPISVDDLKQRLVRNPKELRRFIKYHMLPGYVTSRDLKIDSWIATCLFEKSLYVNADKQLSGARILSRDINYKHGSIHTLARVLYPIAADSVQVLLDSNPFLSEFAAWFKKYGRLPKDDPVTVFAPTNAAFERIVGSIRKNLAKNDVLKARTVLKHIVPGLWFSTSMPSNGIVLTPMDGVSVTCMTVKYEFDDTTKTKYQTSTTSDKILTFGTSRVLVADLFATNGVIHIVDKLNTDQLELCGFS